MGPQASAVWSWEAGLDSLLSRTGSCTHAHTSPLSSWCWWRTGKAVYDNRVGRQPSLFLPSLCSIFFHFFFSSLLYSAHPIPSLLLYSLFFLFAPKMLHLESIPISTAVKAMWSSKQPYKGSLLSLLYTGWNSSSQNTSTLSKITKATNLLRWKTQCVSSSRAKCFLRIKDTLGQYLVTLQGGGWLDRCSKLNS